MYERVCVCVCVFAAKAISSSSPHTLFSSLFSALLPLLSLPLAMPVLRACTRVLESILKVLAQSDSGKECEKSIVNAIRALSELSNLDQVCVCEREKWREQGDMEIRPNVRMMIYVCISLSSLDVSSVVCVYVSYNH